MTCEEALHDALFRNFFDFDLGDERIADGSALGLLRQLVEWHELGAAAFIKVSEWLMTNGLSPSGDILIDATLIVALPRSRTWRRLATQRCTRPKRQAMTCRHEDVAGVNSKSGLIHSTSITAVNVHARHKVPNLLHGNETRFYDYGAYRGKEQREQLKTLAPKAKDFTSICDYTNRPLTEADKTTNRRKSAMRPKVEHPFLTLKRLWGFAKTRYRGLTKNANHAFVMLVMINLIKWRRPLTGEVYPTTA